MASIWNTGKLTIHLDARTYVWTDTDRQIRDRTSPGEEGSLEYRSPSKIPSLIALISGDGMSLRNYLILNEFRRLTKGKEGRLRSGNSNIPWKKIRQHSLPYLERNELNNYRA